MNDWFSRPLNFENGVLKTSRHHCGGSRQKRLSFILQQILSLCSFLSTFFKRLVWHFIYLEKTVKKLSLFNRILRYIWELMMNLAIVLPLLDIFWFNQSFFLLSPFFVLFFALRKNWQIDEILEKILIFG